jgi:hypothetical protein
VLDEVREWQHRALDRMYPIVIFDALRVKIRDADSRMVKNKAVYIALGVTREGEREVLGLWIADNEGAKFWLTVMTELRNRGVQDILIAVVDGLKGFPEAITAAFPETMVQTCIVHLIRHSMNFCSWKDREAVAADLRPIYEAPTAEEAERLRGKMGREIPLHRPGLAPGMGGSHPVLCLQCCDPEDHLHYQRGGVAEPGAEENAENQGLLPDRGGGHEADLPGHPQLREGRPRRPGMGCRPQSAGHNVRWALRRLTVSENRMGPFRYTEFQKLPKGMSVSFTTAAALVNELMEARDERRLLRVQKQMAAVKLLIIDELGFVPLSKTGAELLFEMISQCYERGATLITSNLPFDEWTETFGTERLTGALLDRLTHHVNILEMNGESYRLAQSRARKPGENIN